MTTLLHLSWLSFQSVPLALCLIPVTILVLFLIYLLCKSFRPLPPYQPIDQLMEHLTETKKNLPNYKDGFIRVRDGTELYYQRCGSGQKVLVLANGLGARDWMWNSLLLSLLPILPQYTLLSWDYRGLFASSPPPQGKHSIRDHADDLLDLINVLGISQIHALIGWSTGVQVGLQFAAMYPSRVLSLVMLNGSYGEAFSCALQPFFPLPFFCLVLSTVTDYIRATSIQIFNKIGEFLTKNEKILRIVFYPYFLLFYCPPLLWLYVMYFRDCFFYHRARHWKHTEFQLRTFQELHANSVFHLLPEIQHPCVVLGGFFDVLFPFYHSLVLWWRLPRAQLFFRFFASHFLLFEHPAAVSKCILSFLASLDEKEGSRANEAMEKLERRRCTGNDILQRPDRRGGAERQDWSGLETYLWTCQNMLMQNRVHQIPHLKGEQSQMCSRIPNNIKKILMKLFFDDCRKIASRKCIKKKKGLSNLCFAEKNTTLPSRSLPSLSPSNSPTAHPSAFSSPSCPLLSSPHYAPVSHSPLSHCSPVSPSFPCPAVSVSRPCLSLRCSETFAQRRTVIYHNCSSGEGSHPLSRSQSLSDISPSPSSPVSVSSQREITINETELPPANNCTHLHILETPHENLSYHIKYSSAPTLPSKYDGSNTIYDLSHSLVSSSISTISPISPLSSISSGELLIFEATNTESRDETSYLYQVARNLSEKPEVQAFFSSSPIASVSPLAVALSHYSNPSPCLSTPREIFASVSRKSSSSHLSCASTPLSFRKRRFMRTIVRENDILAINRKKQNFVKKSFLLFHQKFALQEEYYCPDRPSRKSFSRLGDCELLL